MRWARAGTLTRAPCLMAAADQRSGQIGGDDKPVRLHEQRCRHLGRQLRFRLPRRVLVEQLALETGRARVRGDVLQLVERLIGGDDLQRSGAPIPDADTRIARHAIDECVVHLEAFRRERQQRPAESFEVRHEHSCGGLRRSQTRAAAIEQRDRCAAGHQLVGDGRADHPCADDRDVTIRH